MRRAEHIFHVSVHIPSGIETDGYAIRAYESAGLEDILFGGLNSAGVFEVDFRRRAPRFEDAVLSVINDLRRVFPNARVLKVKPGNLVTLADISERTGHTHEYLRLLVKGKRGPGGFPWPADDRRGRAKAWRRNDVERWFEDELRIEVPAHRHARFLAAVNGLLELQRVAPQYVRSPADARRLASLLPAQLTTG